MELTAVQWQFLRFMQCQKSFEFNTFLTYPRKLLQISTLLMPSYISKYFLNAYRGYPPPNGQWSAFPFQLNFAQSTCCVKFNSQLLCKSSKQYRAKKTECKSQGSIPAYLLDDVLADLEPLDRLGVETFGNRALWDQIGRTKPEVFHLVQHQGPTF